MNSLRHDQKRRRIMEAGIKLGLRAGINAFTMKEVAREARIGKATSYYYFRDKADLVFETARYVWSRLLDPQVGGEAEGLDGLQQSLRRQLRFLKRNPRYLDYIVQLSSLSRAETRIRTVSQIYLRELLARYRRLIEQAALTGQLSVADPEMLLRLLLGSVLGALATGADPLVSAEQVLTAFTKGPAQRYPPSASSTE